MEPVKRSHHNTNYKGPTPEIGDLSAYEVEGQVSSHWRPNSEELAVLVEGGDIEVTVFATPPPPIGVGVTENEGDDALPADPESQEVIECAGLEFRVPQPVASEIATVRSGIADAVIAKMRAIEIKPEHTVIITIPDELGPEAVQGILMAMSQQFPENRACVLPESLKLHTLVGFADLVEAGSEMASAIGKGLLESAATHAKRWNELTNP